MASNDKLIRIIVRMQDEMSQQMDRAASSVQRFSGSMTKVGGVMTAAVTAPLAAAGAAAIKTAIDFERSFASVKKSVDGTPQQLDALNTELRRLATETPLGAMQNAHAEIDRIAAAAGRLGVGVEDIPKFTESIGALAVAADGLDAEQAAEQIARFANVTGMSLNDVDKLVDVIADLGNNFATTEKDILNFGQRMSTLSTFGFAEDEILAIGTALSTSGLSAELGSTNFVKGVTEMTKAAVSGGPELTAFAQTVGKTEEQTKQLLKTNPAGAILQFSQALGNLPVEQQLAILDQMGFTSVEMQRTFMNLANSSGTLSNALDRGNAAFRGNGAAMAEAQAMAETTAGQLAILRSNLALLGDSLGQVVLPAINRFVQFLTPLVNKLATAPPHVQQAVVVFLALVAAIGPLLLIAAQLVAAFTTLMPVIAAVGGVIAGLSLPVIALVGALGLLVAVLVKFGPDAWTSLKQLGQIIGLSLAKGATAIGRFIAKLLHLEGLGKKMAEIMQFIGKEIVMGLVEGIKKFTGKLIDAVVDLGRRAADAIRNALKIRSPSQVMAEIGQQTAAGFQEGVQSGNGMQIPAPSMASAGGRGIGGGIYINNLNVPPGTTREQVDEIMVELGRRMKMRGALGTA